MLEDLGWLIALVIFAFIIAPLIWFLLPVAIGGAAVYIYVRCFMGGDN